jgi:hypothetical protein
MTLPPESQVRSSGGRHPCREPARNKIPIDHFPTDFPFPGRSRGTVQMAANGCSAGLCAGNARGDQRDGRREMKTKIALLCRLVLLVTPVTRAISYDGIVYGTGVEFGFSTAASFVNSTAPNWETDYQAKSNAEFALLVLESMYAIDDYGVQGNAARYDAGVTQGIQNCIDMMDSIGDPVWGTGYPGDPAAIVNEVHEPARRPVVSAADLRN